MSGFQGSLFGAVVLIGLSGCGLLTSNERRGDAPAVAVGEAGAPAEVVPVGSGGAGGAGGAGGNAPAVDECSRALGHQGNLELGPGMGAGQLVSHIDGNLEIYDSSALEQLRCLQSVSGDVDIQFSGDSLEVLARLTTIGGDLSFENNTELVELRGLEALSQVRNLRLVHNPRLERLDALGNLKGRGGDIYIENNPSLGSLTGLQGLPSASNVAILNNAALGDVKGLEGLTRVDGELRVESNPKLRSLAGLSHVTSLYKLYLQDNPSLTTMKGLESLETAGTLWIWENPQLADIDAFATSLTALEILDFGNNPLVTSLDGLKHVRHLLSFKIDNTGVASLSALRDLESVSEVYLYNTILEDLSGLEKAVISQRLELKFNVRLTSLNGLSPDNRQLQYLTVFSNPELVDLSGLQMLQLITESLYVVDNLALTSLVGLESIETAKSVVVSQNPALPSCVVEALVSDWGAEQMDLSGNAPCN